MDKSKLLEWMMAMELKVGVDAGPSRRHTSFADDAIIAARVAFATDADCASLKDPTDTPPPSSWPSVSRIRKETRAEVVAEIVKYLRDTADVIATSITTREQNNAIHARRMCADIIEGQFGA